MIKSDKDIYLEETEVRPNRYSRLVLISCFFISAFCWILNEIGFFRVGEMEMRIGTLIPALGIAIPVLITILNKKALYDKRTKYMVIASCFVFTFSVGTMLTFHTTIMMLFPLFTAMLYRSKSLGYIAAAASFICAFFSPILAYVLGTWDIEYFKELILIGTNGTAVIEGAYPAVTITGIGKILLYIVFPRLLMIGSCILLMFYVISLGADHVSNQILLNQLSHLDSLTGLYNQNYYREVVSSAEGDGIIAVVFFDVNGLKSVNDSFGHEYGDMLLKGCAQSLRNICNGENVNGFRAGGDEFMLLIENADERLVIDKLSEWELSINQINSENAGNEDWLKCSMAYGYVLGKACEIETLIRKADELMYVNKNRDKLSAF